jgi:hypothetical protein
LFFKPQIIQVDIPELVACLVIGYPGNKMSFWQRVGRAGRSKAGLAIFLPSLSNPIDWYFAEHPEGPYFLKSPCCTSINHRTPNSTPGQKCTQRYGKYCIQQVNNEKEKKFFSVV